MTPDALRRAQGVAQGVMSGVSAEQLDDQTPCSQWKVRDLIDHLVGAQHWGRAVLNGDAPSDAGKGSASGDFVAAFADAADQCAQAFAADGALDRTVNLGAEMPASALLGLMVTDNFTHAWDLAKATGQDTDLDPDLAAQLLVRAKTSVPDSFRSEDGAIFGPEQTAPAGGSAADELAAFLGRRV